MAEQTTTAPVDVDALHAALRAALNTRKATYSELNQIFKDFGASNNLDKTEVEAALAWAKNPDNDPNLISLVVPGQEPQPAPSELTPMEQSLVGAQITAREPTIRDQMWNAIYQGAEALGADRNAAQRTATFLAGLGGESGKMGVADLTPLGFLTAIEEGTATAKRGLAADQYGTAALGGLEAGLGILGAVPVVGGAARAALKPALRAAAKTEPGMALAARTAISRPELKPQQQAVVDILTRPVNVAEVPAIQRAPIPQLAEVAPTPKPRLVPAEAQAVAAEVPPSVAPQTQIEALPTPDWVTLTPEQRRATLETRMAPANQAGTMEAMAAQGMTEPTFSTPFNENMSKFMAEYLNTAKLTRPENVPFSEFFLQHISAGTLPAEETTALLRKYKLDTAEDIASAIAGQRISAAKWGRDGQILSVASRYVPKEAADLATLGVQGTADPTLWRRMGNVQRGLMVSQLATTMRNNISSVGRMGLDTLTNLVDDAINIALNPVRKITGQETITPTGAFSLITQRFQPERNKDFYRQLRNASPKLNNRLLATYSSDISRQIKPDAFGKIEKAVDVLNLANRVSETAIRKMGFTSFLKREVDRAGGVTLDGTRYSFNDLVDNNMVHMIPDKYMEKALERTLDLTYANPAKSKIVNDAISLIEKTGPVGATLVPFPRFIANAMRFQLDHSPAGLFKLLSKKQREAIMAGDTEVLSKAVTGSAMLYAAYEFQNSEYAGSKWYTAKLPNGTEVDLRPFFPAAPYLLVADVIKRFAKGENVDLAYTAKDLVQGMTGAQFRAGAGLYAIDELFKDAAGVASDPKKIIEIPAKIVANYAGSLLTPLNMAKDFYAAVEPEEAIYRDTSESVLARALRPVPGAQRALGAPAQEYASREGDVATQNPALRQLLGATILPEANIIEKEMRRLGFDEYDLIRRTGLAEADREQKRLVGAIAEANAEAYFNQPEYKNADIIRKTEMFKEFYAGVRKAARDEINKYNPNYAALMWFSGRDREEKARINQQTEAATGKTFVQFYRQLDKAPMVTSEEMFNSLPKGTKFTDPGDYKVYTKK